MSRNHRPAGYYRLAARWLDAHLAQGIEVVPCAVCGLPVDLNHRGRDPDSRSVDHLVPVSKGGPMLDTSLWRVAHYRCNTARGNKTPRPKLRPSRAW